MPSKPTLLFVATRVPYPPVTGHYLRTFHILRGLAEHYAVHFFGFWDKTTAPSEQTRAREALLSLCVTVHAEPVPAERSRLALLADLLASMLRGQPFTAAKYRSRPMLGAIRGLLAQGDVAVAHADSLQSGQYVRDVTCPKLLTEHNVEHLRLASQASRQRSALVGLALRVQASLTRRYEAGILRSIGNCVAVSQSDRTELERLSAATRFFVVPNGADTSEPPLPAADPSLTTALWVGGMNDPFNRDAVAHFASRILPRIRERIPAFRWLVVGRDPPPSLRRIASDAGSGVELSGFVPSVRDAYSRSAIVVVPLLSGGGTKLKVLEAMAMGRAIVTTPVGAEGIEARDGIEMEIAATDEEFASRSIALLRDPARRDRIAAAAHALAVREYSWDAVNRRMHAAVRTVIETDSSRGAVAACAG